MISRGWQLFATVAVLFCSAGLAWGQETPAEPDAVPQRDALVEYRRGNYGAAIEITRDEIAQNPARLDAYVVLGWSLMAQDRWREAADAAQQAVSLRRWDARVLHILGESHYRLGNYETAIQRLQEYLAVNPQGSQRSAVYFYLGDALYRVGEYHHADIALSSAVEFSPDNPRWWVVLGNAREQAGQTEIARAAYQRALDLQPGLSDAQAALARLAD
ncbi:tetratricopeptide repeat protein [Spirochaeta africana]|uniref:Uncharacterized protein n=1 Tax=Spirochaeta africana (strain ATCC 700263 / DSM 8902 / Z-7692) TaxID=889378 RepID=H9UL43_SPIAZ|nr:tetratricopeptide repeat protein [Spirochaeta africana]AFG38236.1 hypothetical protein Spiaf_2200 [Spirochaeta africana DSM 8902]